MEADVRRGGGRSHPEPYNFRTAQRHAPYVIGFPIDIWRKGGIRPIVAYYLLATYRCSCRNKR